MLDTLQACDNYDLKIGTKRAAVVYQPVAGNPYNEPNFTANGQRGQVLDKFTYLAVPIVDEVAARIIKASVAFGRLRGNVRDRRKIRLDNKLNVYTSFGSANPLICTWDIDQQCVKRRNRCHLL